MKILFFDIDGTLLDSNGDVAESTKKSLKQAQGNGHKIFVCTGRSKSQIMPEILEIGFDGFVTVAGAEAWVGDEVIYQSFMEEEQVERFLQFFEIRNCSYGLQTAAGTLCTKEGWDKTKERFLRLGASKKVTDTNMQFFEQVENLHGRHDVEKMFFNFIPETVTEVQTYLGDYFHVEQSSFSGPDPHSGEITKQGIDKATGMAEVMKFYGLGPEDAIAFGDGPNDMEMLSYAGYGVAMGNGRDKLKAIADYVTSDIFHDGIQEALRYLELI